MPALLELSTVSALGFLCALAGFLLIAASVAFVVKGKAVLGDTSGNNTIEWGKIKANLTSAVSLFVLGAAMIALPFWRFAQDAAREPATAILKGKITGAGSRQVRLLLVVKPDYDQSYGGDIVWQFPLIARKMSYAVFYIDGDTVVRQQPFSVKDASLGAPPQEYLLPDFELQTGGGAQQISPKLEVSDAELKKLGIN